jgi:hypothetical protein
MAKSAKSARLDSDTGSGAGALNMHDDLDPKTQQNRQQIANGSLPRLNVATYQNGDVSRHLKVTHGRNEDSNGNDGSLFARGIILVVVDTSGINKTSVCQSSPRRA